MAKPNFTTCPHCGKNLLPTFDSTAPIISTPNKSSDDWRTLLAAAGLTFAGSYFVIWWEGYNPVWAALAAVAVGLLLPTLKTVLHAPPRPEKPAPPKESRIKVTMTTPLPNGNHVQLDETFGVPDTTLVYVADRVINDGQPLARRKIRKRGKCSQGQFEQIQATLIKNHWAVYKDPDTPTLGVVINRHGQAVFRAVLRERGLLEV